MNPFINAQKLDTLTLSGQVSPGYVVLRGLDAAHRKFQKFTGQGLLGGVVYFRGLDPVSFTAEFYLATATEWDDWVEFQKLLARLPIGRNNKGLKIEHGLVNLVGISAVYVEKIKAPVQSEPGLWMAEVEFTEARPPAIGSGKVDGAEASKDDPLSAAVQAQELLNESEYQQLAAIP